MSKAVGKDIILTPLQRETLALRFKGLSLNDIARQMGKSPQAVFATVRILRRKGFDV